MVQDLSSFQAIEMAEYNTASLTSSYAGMNLAASYEIYTGDGFQKDIKILVLKNTSNVGVTISFDGITRHDFIEAGGRLVLDLQTNHSNNSSYSSGTLNGRQGQIIFGRGTAGTGSFYITGYR